MFVYGSATCSLTTLSQYKEPRCSGTLKHACYVDFIHCSDRGVVYVRHKKKDRETKGNRSKRSHRDTRNATLQ